MTAIETKIHKSLQTNKLNPEILGERYWYNYFISVIELVWVRNNHNGYKIEVYSDETKMEHLTTVIFKNIRNKTC